MADEWDSPAVGSEAIPSAPPIATAAPSVPVNATRLLPSEEKQYQDWKTTLPDRLRYEGDYDLRGFWKKNPKFSVDVPGQHMTDEFKLPNHPTFSNESRYYNDKTKHLGGHWMGDVYIPNDSRYKQMVDESEGASPNDPPPAFLTKRPKGAPRDEWDAAPAEEAQDPRLSRQFTGAGTDLKGQIDAAKADLDAQNPGLVERAKRTAAGLKDTVVGGAKAVRGALPESLGGRGFLNTIADPSHRREFERGLSDMVTLGYAEKLANKVSDKFDTPENNFGAHAAEDREKAPDDRALGRAAGMALPGAGSAIGKIGGKLVAPAFEGIEAGTRAGAMALGAARGVAGYEAAAPVTAALSADASGHRLDSAVNAATDPVGLGTSAMGGAVAEPVAKNLVEHARERATKDIAHDIIAAEGPRARMTDQLRISKINDRLFDATKESPELRAVFRMPGEKGAKRLNEITDVMAAPLDAGYQAVDSATGGGIRLGDIIDGYRSRAKALMAHRETLEEGKRLGALADQELESAAIRQGDRVAFDPNAPVNAEGTTAGQQISMLERSAAIASKRGDAATAATLADEIAKTRAMASKPAGIDLDERMPTQDFRRNVTALHKTANSVLGGLEGTPRHDAAMKLYDEAKTIIDKHLDSSGVPSEKLAEIRKINDRYFLLKTAQEAMASRAVKESNRPPIEQLLHSPRRALNAGGTLGIVGAAAIHPHAIPAMAGALALGHAAPGIASRVNWRLANVNHAAAADFAGRVAPSIGATVGARAVGPEIARESSDRAIAQIIQGAQGGTDPAELLRFANDNGVDPRLADSIIKRYAAQPVSP